MNVRQIEVFRAVYAAGSISGGARQLHISQPAVSRMIRHLEDQLGYQLFRSERGRIAPTLQANVLFRESGGLTERLHRIADVARNLRFGQGERLAVLSYYSCAVELVPRALEATLKVFPDLAVSIGAKSPAEQMVDVLRMDADIGIAGNIPELPDMDYRTLGRDRIVAVLRADSPLAAEPVARFAALAGESLVSSTIGSPVGRRLDEAFAEHGHPFRPKVEIMTPVPAFELVRRLGHVALIGGMAAEGMTDRHGLVLRPLEAEVSYEVRVFWNRNTTPSAARDLFVTRLQAEFATAAQGT